MAINNPNAIDDHCFDRAVVYGFFVPLANTLREMKKDADPTLRDEMYGRLKAAIPGALSNAPHYTQEQRDQIWELRQLLDEAFQESQQNLRLS